MVPFFGTVDNYALILITLIYSLVTFKLVIGCAWVSTRPLISAILFSMIIILLILSRIARDYIIHIKDGGKLRLASRIFMEESNFLDY
jgi:cadmium resistance protein CadD (predicted permease)